MVSRKAVNKLRNLVLKNLILSTGSKYKQVSTKLVPHPSSSENEEEVQFTN